MRRRSSGSAAEEEGDDCASNADTTSTSEVQGGRCKSEENTDPYSSSQATPRHSNTPENSHELDRRKSTDQRPSTARSRLLSSTNWKSIESRNGQMDKKQSAELNVIGEPLKEPITMSKMTDSRPNTRRSRLRSPWSCSPLTFVTTIVSTLFLAAILHSFTTRQLDTKGCRMSFMRPSFAKLSDFDTEHTRFASKYSVYLYREGQVDEDTKVWIEAMDKGSVLI